MNEQEAHLGARLLNRKSHTLSLTDGGETLFLTGTASPLDGGASITRP